MRKEARVQAERASEETIRAEIELAVSGIPDEVVPDIRPDWNRILDVGCSAGQSLVALDVAPAVELYGVDVELSSLRTGQQWDDRIRFIQAPGENIPFASESFDLVSCRTALPYMHVATALLEMRRVLRPGGRLWFTVFPARVVWGDLRASIADRHAQGALFHVYRLTNGAFFDITGKQFRFPFGQRRCESYQTERCVRRSLGVAGFSEIEVETRPTFVVISATKTTRT